MNIEKIEEIENDIRYEQELRTNYDFCINEAIEQFELEDVVKKLDLAVKWIESSGWEIDRCTLIRDI